MTQGTPRLSLIWAMAENRVIGIENRLPWHMPADLKRFRELTYGHHIVMGRKTFESFPKPLAHRTHIVVSRDPDYRVPAGCIAVTSIDNALNAAPNETEIFVIGGASVYAQTLARAHRLYMTLIHTAATGDTHFPDFDLTCWREQRRERHPADAANPHPYSFIMWERN